MNNKNFQRGLAAVMLLMMVIPLVISTHVAINNYNESQQADANQEVVAMENLDEENN